MALLGFQQTVQLNPLRLRITIEKLGQIKRIYNPSNSVWRRLLADVRKVLQEETEKRFQTQTDPDGKPWAKLRRPRTTGSGILTKTRTLRNSFQFPLRTDPTSLKRWVEFQVKTDVPYAKFHQEGTRKMVARPFLGVSSTMWVRIDRLLRDFERNQKIR